MKSVGRIAFFCFFLMNSISTMPENLFNQSLYSKFYQLSVLKANELTAKEIIEKVNDLLTVETSYSRMEMTIETTSGGLRTFLYDSWTAGKGDRTLIRYLKPRRVKDQAVLMRNQADDIWMYFPRTQRVRKLATHAKKQKMQGSDFSYEDMGSGDAFLTDYITKKLENEEVNNKDCYKLKLIRRKDSDMSYQALIMLVDKESFVPLIIDYYYEDHPERVEKRLIQNDIQVISGIPTAMNIVMQNQNDHTQTRMKIIKIDYGISLEEKIFTERGLKR